SRISTIRMGPFCTRKYLGRETLVRRDHHAPAERLPDVLAEFDVPIGEVEEMFPTIVRHATDRDVDERTPLRALRLLDEMHAGFGRRAVGFACVAQDASADDVFPRR